MSSRRFSTRELLAYISVFSVLVAGWCLEDRRPLLIWPVLFLTGATLGAPVGLAIGGRKWFIPAGLIGSIAIVMLLWISAIYEVP